MTPAPPARADGSGAMFDNIARRYDVLNTLMSFGLHRRWRRQLVDALHLHTAPPGAQVLDVATGTGDVALHIAARYPQVRVVGLDPSVKMLDRARQKTAPPAPAGAITWCEGDAQALPQATGTFAAACISFGIRNVPDRLLGLQEMRRVVAPGGIVAVLELSEPTGGPVAALARFHVHTLVPWLGALISGAPEYKYLQRSIAAFPEPQVFATLMARAGLHDITVTRLCFGALHLYTGRVR